MLNCLRPAAYFPAIRIIDKATTASNIAQETYAAGRMVNNPIANPKGRGMHPIREA